MCLVTTSQIVFGQHNNMKNMRDMDAKSQKKTAKKNSQKTVKTQTDQVAKEHNMDMNIAGKDTMNMRHDNMDRNMKMSMSHAYSLNLPMSRDGSGTGWLPDASAMYGYMVHAHGWMFMFHGDLFIRYNKQDFAGKGTRGDSKVDAPDMLMAMGQKKMGNNGLFHFNIMLSTDAIIAGGNGYPLLFQTGESWQGKPLVDRQHPHDLFSELSVSYGYAFSKKTDAFVYIGYPGEPALGPVVFMHRISGKFNPDAPISHHWVDATHITFGVATIGVRCGLFKIEGSSFTGREPDENRYNFDKPRFDSWSSRLSFNTSENWALQVSDGFIKSPEALHPGEDINRITASATYSYRLSNNKYFDATTLWGVNRQEGISNSNAALVEANLKCKKADFYTRYEWVQKSGEELNLDNSIYGAHILYPVNAVTAGFSYDLFTIKKLRFAPGTQFSMYHAGAALHGLYGKTPFAWEIYLHLYPGLM
jgi:hypothetical protein